MKNDKYYNKVHVVYASDDRFAEIMGVSLVSLFENSKDIDQITVYILDSSISNSNKHKIESVCNQYGRKNPYWIPAKNISKELQMDITVDRGSLSQYARIFVSSILPNDIERVLYLDCDVIINKSISELWNLNMKGKTIAALMDAFGKSYRENIGLQPNDIMFNSGVMLIDLNKWRKQHIEKRLLQFISSKNGKVQQGDQGALNAILSRDTFCFEPRFNSITIFYDFTYEEMMIYRKPPQFYTKSEVKKAIEEPSIIHFTTSFLSIRPWIKGSQHYYTKEWIKYKNLSPWSEMPLWDLNQSYFKKIVIGCFNILPRKYAIFIAGILQAYGRPLKNKLVDR